ncbi:YhcB family protein [Alishewanella longhuensis]
MDYTWLLIGSGIGLVVGAVAARLFSLKQFGQHKLQQELDESRKQLSQYRLDVSEHLETTNQLMSQLQDNYSRIARHVQQSKMQLVEQPVSARDEVNFFAADTTQHIKQSLHQLNERRRQHSQVEQQPKDYSGEASGLIRERPSKDD